MLNPLALNGCDSIFFFFSAFLLPPDSEFVEEASSAPYSPEELGKSAPFAFSSRNPAREPGIWGAPGSNQPEGRRDTAREHTSPAVRSLRGENWPFPGGESVSLPCVCVCVPPDSWYCSLERGTTNFPTWGPLQAA